MLIAAQSGRALAAAARRAGYWPLVADLFGDADTRELAAAYQWIEGGIRGGLRASRLLPALRRLAATCEDPPVGLILGSGFEDRPRLVARLASDWRLLGSPADVIAAVKDPFRLASVCGEHGIPHPLVRGDVPAGEAGRFLLRRQGGSGGVHIHPASERPVEPGHYLVERRSGEPWSLGFVAHPGGAVPVGFCRQWAAPTRASPYRFGGIAGPLALPERLAAAIRQAADDLSRAFGLVGLCSLDVLIDGETWCVCEINPRPGASLDVLDRGEPPLISAHIAACDGTPIDIAVPDQSIRACEIVYAAETITIGPDINWPDCIFDRPVSGATIRRGWPIATVMGTAPGHVEARALATSRAAALGRRLSGGLNGENWE